MTDSQATTASLTASEHDPSIHSPAHAKELDLSTYPRMFVLETFLAKADLAELELKLKTKGATLALDINGAQLILTAVSKSPRAELELRRHHLKLETTEAAASQDSDVKESLPAVPQKRAGTPLEFRKASHKARKTSLGLKDVSPPSTDDEESAASSVTIGKEVDAEEEESSSQQEQRLALAQFINQTFVKVVKVAWLNDSLSNHRPQPLDPYTLYEGNKVTLPDHSTTGSVSFTTTNVSNTATSQQSSPLLTTKLTSVPPQTPQDKSTYGVIKTSPISLSPKYSAKNPSFRRRAKKPPLLRETTSEHEESMQIELPDWIKEGKNFACERVTLQHSPNEKFLDELRVIRHARELTNDEIGVRSYSTIIASIAAYPTALKTAAEVVALPGCEKKAAELFRQFQIDSVLAEARTVRNDEYLKTIDLFWHIHGVGPAKARDLYNMGCRDMDDVATKGWESLHFEQRVGVKYYDEFLEKIPRPESEKIASIVWEHAQKLMGEEVQCMIVGGYRRGKAESGDVDIILSHPDEEKTLNKIEPLVASLGRSGWVTHELELHRGNSKRDQKPIPANLLKEHHGTFDTLDKALLVWQDPTWPTKKADRAADPKAKNPAVHRRVDIIISPWKTVGCAVMGWSSGTTFQRDTRRYAKVVKGWKFDSSGVRDRRTGKWIDLEKSMDPEERAKTIPEAERRVFEGMEFEWREPWERCTD